MKQGQGPQLGRTPLPPSTIADDAPSRHGSCFLPAMARPLRIIQTESPYHLMCRTNNREFRFVRKIITRIFFQVLAKSAEKYNVRVHHVVLMSNHYHLIVSATERNIHRFMQYLNARVAVRYNKATGHSGHVWGDRYKACIIQSDEHYRHVVRYIYRNPLRAGMVRDLAAFENSSFPFYAYGRKIHVPLAPDHLVRDLDGDRSKVAWYFKNLVLDEESPFPSDHLIKASLRRRCYGAEGFLQRLLAALPHGHPPTLDPLAPASCRRTDGRRPPPADSPFHLLNPPPNGPSVPGNLARRGPSGRQGGT